MKRTKYLILRTEIGDMPIEFPACLKHKDMVPGYHLVIAAGFRENEKCCGEAESLGIGSRGAEDDELFRAWMGRV